MSTILYVNYAPYGNAGHILDYLKENFDDLIYISFIFHPVEQSSKVQIYHKGKLLKGIFIPTLLVPKNYVHHFAPLLSVISGIELITISIYAFFKFKIRPQIFLAPNAFLILIGIMLRALSLVDKVVFWVWDYYPIPKEGFYKKVFYRAYCILDRRCTYMADFVWYLNQRLLEIREKLGIVSDMSKSCIASLGINRINTSLLIQVRVDTLGFFGVLKKSQGLELLLGSLPELVAAIPNIRIEIIGSGPDEGYFKELTNKSSENHRVTFYGFIDDEQKVKKIVASWTASAALYIPIEENLSAYTDPSKVKFYLGCGIPVIVTKVPLLAEEIHKKGAGIAIEYNTKELISAVIRIFAENNKYRENAIRLAHKFDYKKVYDNTFSMMAKRLWPSGIFPYIGE